MSNQRQGMSDVRGILTLDNSNIDISSVMPLAEADGTPKYSLYGKVGSTLTAISLAVGGAQDMVMHGEDSGGNVDPLRTNADQQLQVEVVPLERPIQLDAILLPSTDAALLDGSAVFTSGGVYEVTFNVVNIDGTNPALGVTVGIDLAGGGSVAAAEQLMVNVTIPAGGRTGDITVTMAADDDIFGGATSANDAAMHFTRIVRVA